MPLKIKLMSLMVDNQDNALEFYTNTLGFVKKMEIEMGVFKWLTVVSTDSDYVQLSLEPNSGIDEAKAYQRALLDKGIPAASFEVDDIDLEYRRLSEKGVVFKDAPKLAGAVKIAIFHDTVGNLIQIHQAI